MNKSKKRKVKGWALVKRGVFSHVELNEEAADTWRGFQMLPCVVTYTLPTKKKKK